MSITLYQQKKTGKVWQWQVHVDSNRVVTTYGECGGKLQSTTEIATAKNVGRANEVSPEEQATLLAERYIQEKRDHGYQDTPEEAMAANPGESLDYNDPPKEFCPSKPVSEISTDDMEAMWLEGRMMVQRKYDGMCCLIFVGDKVRIFTRGKLEERTNNFPHITSGMSRVPKGSILVCEMVAPLARGGDDFKYVSSVLRTKDPEKAIGKQRENGSLECMLFDVLHWGGEDITSRPYRSRFQILSSWLQKDPIKKYGIHIPQNLGEQHTPTALFGDDSLAVQQGWEGYVLWDMDGTTRIRYDGKEDRRNAYKWKPLYTEDVWAEEPYTGRKPSQMAGVHMYQYIDGERIFVGKCGGGFSKEERERFWKNRDSQFPCAIEVETPERFSTLILRFPQFQRLRPDKSETDCTVQLKPRS